MAGTVTSERVEKLLAELMDADLVRVYEAEGARFLFVPRFRQRLRFTNSRYPSPPNGINDLTEKKTDSSQSQDGLKTAEVKRREEKQAQAPDPVWGLGLSILTAASVPEADARRFVGMCLATHTQDAVLEALRAADGKADPRAYVRGVLKTTPKKSEPRKAAFPL